MAALTIHEWPRVSAQNLAIACVSFKFCEISSNNVVLQGLNMMVSKKKGHHPLIGQKMGQCKLTNPLLIVEFKI